MKNQNIHKYYFILKTLFPRINFKEGKFLHELKLSLKQYEIDHPNATYEEILHNFGTPDTIVSDYISNQDMDYVFECVKKKKYWKYIIILLGIAILLCCFTYGIFCYYAAEESTDNIIRYERIETGDL